MKLSDATFIEGLALGIVATSATAIFTSGTATAANAYLIAVFAGMALGGFGMYLDFSIDRSANASKSGGSE